MARPVRAQTISRMLSLRPKLSRIQRNHWSPKEASISVDLLDSVQETNLRKRRLKLLFILFSIFRATLCTHTVQNLQCTFV